MWCPVCIAQYGDTEVCRVCGARQSGEDAARLREVVYRLHQLRTETAELTAERDRMASRLRAPGVRQPAGPPTPPSAADDLTPTHSGVPPEFRADVVRNLLLGLGAALVAIAAVIFSVIAWSRLGDSGRGAMLVAATVLAAAAALTVRRRLPATAEALTAVTVAFFLVDWYAARRAGIGDGVDATAWWALATGSAAALSAIAGLPTFTNLAVGRIAAALLVQTAALLALISGAGEWVARSTGLASLSAGAAATAALARRTTPWRAAAGVLAAGAVVAWISAPFLLIGAPDIEDPASAVGPAIAVILLAVAPGAARVMSSRTAGGHLLVAAATAPLVAGTTVLSRGWLEWPAAVATGATVAAVVLGLARHAFASIRTGAAAAGALGLALASASATVPIAVGWLAPLTWIADSWSGSIGADAVLALTDRAGLASGDLGDVDEAVAILLAVVAGAVVAAMPIRRPQLVSPGLATIAGGGAGAAALALVPLAAGATVGSTWTLLLLGTVGAIGAAAAVDRADLDPMPTAAVAALIAVPMLGWSFAIAGTTVVALAAIAVSAAAATALVRAPATRTLIGATASLATLAAVTAAVIANGQTAAAAGVALVITGGVLLGAVVHLRHGANDALAFAVELVGAAGAITGIALSVADDTLLAVALTVAVPIFLVPALEPRRRAYAAMALGAAVASSWAWFAAAGVELLEAYTLPAAGAAGAAGFLAVRRPAARPLPSWLTFGPALVIVFAPSTLAVLVEGGAVRPLAISAAALASVVVGAAQRLQAPLSLGAVTLLVLGIDAVAPVAARLPRWATIGTIGLLLLWLGATAERRLREVKRARETFGRLR